MLKLTPFSLTWPGDWSAYCRLMDAYLSEVCTEEDYRDEIADLNDPELSAELIRQSMQTRNPCFMMRILLDEQLIGLITYSLYEPTHRGFIKSFYVEPAYRRQGYGSQAYAMAEKQLKQLGAWTIALRPEPKAIPFHLGKGFQPDEKGTPLYIKLLPDTADEGSSPVQLLCYTRTPLEEAIYAPKLADSVHLALIEKGVCTPLLHNSGIVYAKAVPDEQGVLHPYSLREPWLTRLPDGQWAIVARRIECDGTADAASADHVLFFTSPDLIHYTEQPLLHESDPLAQAYFVRKAPELGEIELPEGCIPHSVIDIPEEVAARLRTRFLTPVNIANDVPAQVEAASPAELDKVRAIARYSDGSSVEKRVDWQADGVDWTKPGCYEIEGCVHQDHYEFPTMWNKADPAMCRWEGKYYFISTNDLDWNHTLYIRVADSIPGLVTAQQHLILDNETYPHLGNLLWAPEMHIIGGRLYIFHAGTPGPFVQEQSHVMALKPGGNPIRASDWEMSRRVVRRDGSPLFEKGITLDMTVFHSAGKLYAAWSQRQFDPVDQGAWLYIAQLDPEQPWRLLTDPQVLTVPEYGWENNHTFVVEGPFALYRSGKILLTYSGALVDSTYVVGLLSMDEGKDPLDLANWTKENYPLLTSQSVPGEFGPGHNAYITDEDGLTWNTYHARPGVNGPRSSGIRRVHFNCEDFPVLDLTEEMDLDPKLKWVKTTVVVK